MSVPACSPHHYTARAIYLDPFSTERVFVVGPNTWAVRRGAEMVPLDNITPQPAALELQSGFVEDGDYGRWPDLRTFLRDHGVEVSRKAAKRGGKVAHGGWIAVGLRMRAGSDSDSGDRAA